jgi:hypothetical protein
MKTKTTLEIYSQAAQKCFNAMGVAEDRWTAELKSALVEGRVERGGFTKMGAFRVVLDDVLPEDVAGLVAYFQSTTADRF